jgi:hypothetical protein
MNRTSQPAVTFVIRGHVNRIRELRKELKHMAIDTGRTMSDLFLEAIDQLVTAYRLAAPANNEEARR